MASKPPVLRINEDLLEFEDNLRYYNDAPFNGVGYELFANGQLENETPYQDGLAEGQVSEWDEMGRLRAQYSCRKGMLHGGCKKWHANGVLMEDSHHEWGVELDCKEFDEQGQLVQQRKLDPDNPESNYKILLKLRKIMEA